MGRLGCNEVVTRDGFLNEPAFVPTDAKVALIDELSACGYAKSEATPCVRDGLHPPVYLASRPPCSCPTRVVPNARGAERPGCRTLAGAAR